MIRVFYDTALMGGIINPLDAFNRTIESELDRQIGSGKTGMIAIDMCGVFARKYLIECRGFTPVFAPPVDISGGISVAADDQPSRFLERGCPVSAGKEFVQNVVIGSCVQAENERIVLCLLPLEADQYRLFCDGGSRIFEAVDRSNGLLMTGILISGDTFLIGRKVWGKEAVFEQFHLNGVRRTFAESEVRESQSACFYKPWQ